MFIHNYHNYLILHSSPNILCSIRLLVRLSTDLSFWLIEHFFAKISVWFFLRISTFLFNCFFIYHIQLLIHLSFKKINFLNYLSGISSNLILLDSVTEELWAFGGVISLCFFVFLVILCYTLCIFFACIPLLVLYGGFLNEQPSL